MMTAVADNPVERLTSRQLRRAGAQQAGLPVRRARLLAFGARPRMRRLAVTVRLITDRLVHSGAIPAGGLPDGHYYFLLHEIAEQYGGLTTSSLARAAAFARAGQRVTMVMFGPIPRFDTLAAELVGRGTIPVSGVSFRSLHQDLVSDAWAGSPQLSGSARPEQLGPLDEEVVLEHDDHTPWQVDLKVRGSESVVCREYRRADGTPYLRQHLARDGTAQQTRLLERLDSRGRLIATFPSIPALYRSWLSALFGPGDGRWVFTIADGPMASRHLLGLNRPDLLRIGAVHSSHVKPPGRYDGALKADRAHLIRRSDELDGLVLLTGRQREDVELRLGLVNNLFTVPHAARPLAALPDPEQRRPHRVVIVTRLAPIKRLDQAIRAFVLVRESITDATLDIYGSGTQAQALQRLVTGLGLDDAVTFHGFDPLAAVQFQTAAVTVLTSLWEGQPVTLLEAMGAGCPVVAYDIKYGPADAIESGVSGVLVPDGDISGLASAVTRLLSDRGAASLMGWAAWKRSQAFSEDVMVARWRRALDQMVAQQSRRVRLGQVSLLASSTDCLAGGAVAVSASLVVKAQIPAAAAGDVRLRWLLIGLKTAEQVSLPARWQVVSENPGGATFAVTGDLPAQSAEGLRADTQGVEIHLDLAWNNAHWRELVGIWPAWHGADTQPAPLTDLAGRAAGQVADSET